MTGSEHFLIKVLLIMTGQDCIVITLSILKKQVVRDFLTLKTFKLSPMGGGSVREVADEKMPMGQTRLKILLGGNYYFCLSVFLDA